MRHKWLAFYLANWYACAVAGLLMSMQHPAGSWLASLPWTTWGTEFEQALAGGAAVSGGAVWILMGALLTALGAATSLVAGLLWLSRPAAAPTAPPEPGPHEAPLSDTARDAAALVQDPGLRTLMQQLNTRLG
ncbi:MAG: hypothetical protein RIS88_102 [Pseudomonadota bacterium]|jgi:hypothetical protein